MTLTVRRAHSGAKAMSMAEVAFASYGSNLPQGMEQALEAVSTSILPISFGHSAATAPWSRWIWRSGASRSRNTSGSTTVATSSIPIVEGQIHGGIAQGIAQALLEEAVYDADGGQLKTGTLLDYLIPTAGRDLPCGGRTHGDSQSHQRIGCEGSLNRGRPEPAQLSSMPSPTRWLRSESTTWTCQPPATASEAD